MKIWAIDLDGTLGRQGKPIRKNINKCNKLYEGKFNFIIIYTARNETAREETLEYLKKLGVNYHLLVMEKLKADVYIDDRMEKW